MSWWPDGWPLLTTLEIRRLLGGEPWNFPPQVLDQMTRFEAFEVYLKPDPEAVKASQPPMTHREAQFANWLGQGDAATWADCERMYQERMTNGRPNASRRSRSDGRRRVDGRREDQGPGE